MTGITELGSTRSRAISIDVVLERLDIDLRAHLLDALLDLHVPSHEIVRACGEDGYIVTDWSIQMWRRRNA